MNSIRIFKSEGWYVAEIPSLHVVTRAKTLTRLKKNIKEAVDVAVEGMLVLKSMNTSKLHIDEKKLAYA